jgi:hypothetical protein
MKSSADQKNAENAYVDVHAIACDLVGRINDLLQNLPAPGNESIPIHWGHVGNLNHVNATLLEVVSFLEGKNR